MFAANNGLFLIRCRSGYNWMLFLCVSRLLYLVFCFIFCFLKVYVVETACVLPFLQRPTAHGVCARWLRTVVLAFPANRAPSPRPRPPHHTLHLSLPVFCYASALARCEGGKAQTGIATPTAIRDVPHPALALLATRATTSTTSHFSPQSISNLHWKHENNEPPPPAGYFFCSWHYVELVLKRS